MSNSGAVTLADMNALAVLDLGGEIEDPHHWPDEAIAGLRVILARGGAA